MFDEFGSSKFVGNPSCSFFNTSAHCWATALCQCPKRAAIKPEKAAGRTSQEEQLESCVMSDNLEQVLMAAAAKHLVTDESPSIDLIDLDYLGQRIDELQEAFPEPFFLHAAALKANSLRGVLHFAAEKGLGAECASISEVEHAISLGFPPQMIIYDSPCKTKVCRIT